MLTFLLVIIVLAAGAAACLHIYDRRVARWRKVGDSCIRESRPIVFEVKEDYRETRRRFYRKRNLRPVDPDARECKPHLKRGRRGYWYCFGPSYIGFPGFGETKREAYDDWKKHNT